MLNERLCCEFNVFIEALQRLEVTEVKLLAFLEMLQLWAVEVGDEAHAELADATRCQEWLEGASAEQNVGIHVQSLFHFLSLYIPK